MMTSDDKVGGWVKKGQNHDYVILEWSPRQTNKQESLRELANQYFFRNYQNFTTLA